MQKTCSYTH